MFLVELCLFFSVSYLLVIFFFFSSRRRHTRCLSDWSSDVCSSDLNARFRCGCLPGDVHSELFHPARIRIEHLELDTGRMPNELATRRHASDQRDRKSVV